MAEEKPCPTCTGDEKPWPFGKFCEKHDVCRTCGIGRKQLTQTPWGVRIGAFQCAPCEEKERKARIAERQEKGFDHQSTDEVVCPCCGYEFSDSWEMSDGAHDCPECHNEFDLERNVTVDYTTTRKKVEA